MSVGRVSTSGPIFKPLPHPKNEIFTGWCLFDYEIWWRLYAKICACFERKTAFV